MSTSAKPLIVSRLRDVVGITPRKRPSVRRSVAGIALHNGAFPLPEKMKTAAPSRAGGKPFLRVAHDKPGFKRHVKRKYPPTLNQKHLPATFPAQN